MSRGFREMVPCVASSAASDAGRYSLGHRYPTGTEFRILWIGLHGHSDEHFFRDHVPSQRHEFGLIDNCTFQSGVPTSKSRENVRVQCILYRSLCGYTSIRYMVVCDIWLIATMFSGAQASSRTSLANDLPQAASKRDLINTRLFTRSGFCDVGLWRSQSPKTYLGCNTTGHSTRGRAHPIYFEAKRALSSFYCMT